MADLLRPKRVRRTLLPAAFALLAQIGAPGSASAQEPTAVPPQAAGTQVLGSAPLGTSLGDYYDAMAERRLIAPETGSAEGLRALSRQGEELYLDGRYEEAQRVLYEAVESPRYRDFDSLDAYRSAEYMLASALHRLGALRSAWRYLERILARGPEDAYFGPAYRRAVDVALAAVNPGASVLRLEQVWAEAGLEEENLPIDALNELRYLRGRAAYDAHEWAVAVSHFEQVGRRSRFYANARYLQGAIAAQGGQFSEAEDHFCSIATTEDTDHYTFFVDQRYFEIRDLTWLALGRVAHEERRAQDAFYYYFQVPQDSGRVAEALFEAAWSMYEGDAHDHALDLLEQLRVRFPDSPFVHEADLLRGFIHLARCDFEQANNLFQAFSERFSPVMTEVQQLLANGSRQDRLVEQLLESGRHEDGSEVSSIDVSGNPTQPVDDRELMLSLLRVDPEFYRLYAEVQVLDAEAARAGRTAEELGAILARIDGADRPRAAVAAVDELSEVAAMERDLEGARAILRVLTEQLDAMSSAGASSAQVSPLESELAAFAERVQGLSARLAQVQAEAAAQTPVPTEGADPFVALLRRDRAAAHAFPGRVAELRARMLTQAQGAAVAALHRLQSSMGGHLRRARIGRIDAVMGSKRRIEIQIESLAAGRFPPELQDPLAIQGLLRDDEEYWPFEGEYWADEFEEDAGDDDLDSSDEDALDPADDAAMDEQASLESSGRRS